MAKRKTDVSDKLAKLRDKLANTNTGGGGNSGFWSPDQGSNLIRILPEVGEMEYFFQEVGQHRIGDTYVYCPSFTTDGEEDCPICQLTSELYRGSEADKKLAGQIRVGKKYWMNIVTRDKDKDTGGDTWKGPFIFTPGVTIFKEIVAIIGMPDYGDITDEEDGSDIYIMREGEKLETKYSIQARRAPCPLAAEESDIDKILDSAADLSYVMLSDDPSEDDTLGEGYIVKLLPYDRIVDEYGLAPGMSAREVSSALNAKSEGARTATSVKEAINKRRSSRQQVEEADDDEANQYAEADAAFEEAASERRRRRRR